MVFHGRAQIDSGLRSGVPRAAVVGFDVSLDCTSDWGERLPHVVVLAVDVGKCRYLWCYARLAQKIQGEFCRFEKLAP